MIPNRIITWSKVNYSTSNIYNKIMTGACYTIKTQLEKKKERDMLRSVSLDNYGLYKKLFDCIDKWFFSEPLKQISIKR